MKNNKKKGFTIVELVIVIAVIAILAAVLIPTFIRLIRKSKINADTQLIRNLNTALESDKVEKGNHVTMSDALAAAADFGYDVSKINASATNNEILWDSKNDVFCYLNDGEIEYLPDSVAANNKLSAGSYELWKIYNGAVPDASHQTYSIYLGTAAAAATVSTVSVGIDCGEQEVAAINYENTGDPQTVVIRTNGGTLTVNAQYDTVKHYGDAIVVDVLAVASSSYHEYGTVSFAKIKTGRIVVTEEAEIGGIHIVATESGTDKVYQSISVAVVGNAELPTLTRDSVTEESNDNYAILVVEVQTLATEETVANNTNTEKIWVVGVTEDETKTVSTIATDTSATSSNASSNAKSEETLSESATTLVSSESTVKQSTEEEYAQEAAIINVTPEVKNGFRISIIKNDEPISGNEVTVTYESVNKDILYLIPTNIPEDDSFAGWTSSNEDVIDADDINSSYRVYILSGRGTTVITATTTNGFKAYCVVHNDTEPTSAAISSSKQYVTPDISADLKLTLTASTKTGYYSQYMSKRNYGDYIVNWSIIDGSDIATITPVTNASYHNAILQFTAEGSATVQLSITSPNGTTQTTTKIYPCYITPVADVNGTNYYSFNDAWTYAKNNGGTIKLHNNVVVDKSATVNGETAAYTLSKANTNVTVDLNGFTMSFSSNAYTRWDSCQLIFFKCSNGTLTITDTSDTGTGTIDATISVPNDPGTSYAIWGSSSSTNIVIAGGNFIGHTAWRNNSNARISITGGTFSENVSAATVYGNASNVNLVASGYTAHDNGDGTWTVVANS